MSNQEEPRGLFIVQPQGSSEQSHSCLQAIDERQPHAKFQPRLAVVRHRKKVRPRLATVRRRKKVKFALAGDEKSGPVGFDLKLLQQNEAPGVVDRMEVPFVVAACGNIIMYEIVVKFFILVEHAIRTFVEMLLSGYKPNAPCSNVALNACVESGQYDRAFRYFHLWMQLGLQRENINNNIDNGDNSGANGVPKVVPFRPTVATYSILMKEMDEALQLFNEMPQRNVVSGNYIVDDYDMCGDVDVGNTLFHRYSECGEVVVVQWQILQLLSHAILFNLYASRYSWDDSSLVRKFLRDYGTEQPPGYMIGILKIEMNDRAVI